MLRRAGSVKPPERPGVCVKFEIARTLRYTKLSRPSLVLTLALIMAADLNSIHSGITPTDPTLRPSWDGEQPTLRKFLEYFRNASSKLSPKMAYFVRKGVVADEQPSRVK